MDDLKQHLQLVASGTLVNARIVDRYAAELDSSVLPLINAILYQSDYEVVDPDHLLLALLAKVLQDSTFNEIVEVYPQLFIIDSLNQPDSMASLVCLQIITGHLHDHDLINFLQSNQLVQLMVQHYFTADDIATINQLEILVKQIVNLPELSHELFTAPLIDVYTRVRLGDDSTKIIRLLQYILLILPQIPANFPKLYLIDQPLIDKFYDDVLFIILLVDFYLELIDTKLFPELQLSIEVLMNNYEEYTPQCNDLLSKLSYNSHDEFVKKLVIKYDIFDLTKLKDNLTEPTFKLLSTFNPRILFEVSPDIYSQVLSDLRLLSNEKYFQILLNLIASPDFFDQLKSSYFDSTTLSNLSLDQLYQILVTFSQYTHSKRYFFNDLPIIINTKVLNTTILNNDLYKLQVEILQNLLLPDSNLSQELEFWKSDLQKHLKLLKYGKTFKDIVPQVDVLDETM